MHATGTGTGTGADATRRDRAYCEQKVVWGHDNLFTMGRFVSQPAVRPVTNRLVLLAVTRYEQSATVIPAPWTDNG
jgi:hypothetical protein